ncbi:hypothetical protein Dsin_002962 [Dipteronia sinensis]|uniref:HMA domain-containing protein n=1 Tax=Dipteronia sinensis TaxID=43782 RepID=A0AAE0EJW9_9ROSI|nr:hypothetical protein Dsin_002962 [Dipteronia sinensis]
MISKDTVMAEKTKKVTIMLLKVDLECSKCYNKVKRILCKFPQIQDQVYDEKNNTVMIKVVCCSPEKIRDEICYKGRGTIKSIEILKPPEKPKPADPPKLKPADPPKLKPADPPKPAEKPKPADPPKPAEKPTKVVTFVDVPKPTAPAPALVYPPGPVPPALVYPPGPVPIGFYCTECSEWRGGGPVGYCDGYCGRPVYENWGGGGYRPYYGSRNSDYYFSEGNSQGCKIM